MHAFVHEDNSIGLTFDDGSAVGNQDRTPPTIPPGTYTIRVVDDATEHNFHLSGPGVDQATGTGDTSSPTWTVTLQPGSTYKFQCDTHSDFMYGRVPDLRYEHLVGRLVVRRLVERVELVGQLLLRRFLDVRHEDRQLDACRFAARDARRGGPLGWKADTRPQGQGGVQAQGGALQDHRRRQYARP